MISFPDVALTRDSVLPVLTPLVENGDVKLEAVMNTHKHGDHSGGNDKMLKTFKAANGDELPLIAGRGSPRVTRVPEDGSGFTFGSINVKAIHTPCHTDESICWHFTDSSSVNTAKKTNNAVFTGDTLFSGGCGRFFEGSPAEMDTALNKKLAALPDDTRIYPGHEYTKSNAKFAVSVSSKPEVQQLLDYSTKNEVTTGRWTMGEEKEHNVFMMLQDDEIRTKTQGKDNADVMGKLREMKNNFRG